jgi:hypothetical protein
MSTDYTRTQASGWLAFAAVMLWVAAGIYFLWALNLFADNDWFHQVSAGVFANHVWVWGLWDLAMSFIFLVAGYDVWQGGDFGRLVALIVASVSIVRWLYWMQFAPLAAFAIVVIDVLIIYGVLTTWDGRTARRAAT